jgi:cell fate regulator YaaT (PSP1 superfamily)
MGCSSCGSGGTPSGCGNKGHCTSGSCNKMNTYDWISDLDIHDPSAYKMVEVSFKKGARKDFFRNTTSAVTGDMVVVESSSGYDVGRISLSGELVRAQMKKKRVNEDRVSHAVLRIANTRDLEKLEEARALEHQTLVRARVIARTLGLEMKVGDIEFQGDKRKATFYYTAEGRVDFRELVRSYAKEFKIKVEMRQIGARQESSRIGGIGSCGRELCCSTWLSDFKSVSTTAARYQNISINQSKLSGQCGRLKCCLNYELDTYMDALSSFPKKAQTLRSKKGKAALIKMNIFKGLMYYSYVDTPVRGPIMALDKEDVKKILHLNKKGELPEDIIEFMMVEEKVKTEEEEINYSVVTEQIELSNEGKKSSKGRRSNRRRSKSRGNAKAKRSDNGPSPSGGKSQGDGNKQANSASKDDKQTGGTPRKPKNRNRNKNRNKRRNNKTKE